MKLSPIILDRMLDMYIMEDIHLYLIVTFLYHNGIINRKKLLSVYKSCKEGTLERRIKIHHCKINNKWYDDESMYNIYVDVYKDFRVQIKEIDFNDLIPTLLLYNSKSKNYCIDWFFYIIIKPILDKYNNILSYGFFDDYTSERYIQMIKSFDIEFKSDIRTFDEWERTASDFGYCCEDCSGDYNEYMINQYCYRNINNDKLLKADFSNALNKFKSPEYLKNPSLMYKNYIYD